MTDQTIHDVTDDDRRIARDWAEFVESSPDTWTGSIRVAALVILNDIPAPAPPTLADMTEEERKACQWMQADVANHSVRYVLANPCDGDGEAALVAADGKIRWAFSGYVTPRPDLPRMTWPGD